jgi:hypothetical protein
MNRCFTPGMLLAAAGVVTLAIPSAALGQASFTENFDSIGTVQNGQHGPSGLIAAGWQFRNQSQPQGFGYWYPMSGVSQAGSGSIGIDTNVTQWNGNTSMGSSWAILPAIPGLQAGDPLSFWITDGYMVAGQYARLQVRYSPGGGTSTGSGPSGVGDFSQVLLDIPNVNERPWTQFSTTVPGGGRLAFRFVQPSSASWQYQGTFKIDSLQIGAPPPSPFPIPQSGQTVHWTLAHSPVQINYDLTLPAGSTVIVDPGVEVRIAATMKLHILGDMQAGAGARFVVPINSQFNVHGTVTMAGTQASPVVLDGGPAWYGGENGYQVHRTGVLTIDHAVLNALVKGAPYIYTQGGSRISASNITVTGAERGFYVDRGTLAVRNASVQGGTIQTLESYLLLDNVQVDGGLIVSDRDKAGQPIYFNTITVQNRADQAPFRLHGFDHYFGAQNTIVNNYAAVRLDGAGIAPGSTLPSSGNQINLIDAGYGEGGGKMTWANIGIPYMVTFPGTFVPELSGRLTIAPGTRVKMGPQALLWAVGGTRLDLEGLPEAPISFEQLNPGQMFQGVNYAINDTRPKVEYCTFDGGSLATIADETIVRIENSIYRNNAVGVFSSNWGMSVPRKSRFENNTVGVRTSPGSGAGFNAGSTNLYSPTNPNSLSGNTSYGVEALNQSNLEDANMCWWGHPTGPQHPQNPGGLGDRATGNVSVFPFLTSPPNFADRPPLVRLEDTYFLLEEDNKIILHWQASDDQSIAGFKIYHSTHGENPGLYLLVDNIPGSARSWELTIPEATPASNYPDPSAFRVEAIDNTGQTGFDDIYFFTPYLDFTGSTPPVNVTGPFRPGQTIDVCYTVNGASGTTDAYLFLDGDEQAFSLGGAHTGITCLPLGLTMPPVSTDTARIGIRYNMGAGGRNRWSFTDNFSIRPDPSITGDVAPTVQLAGPAQGSQFSGGSIVPIAWSASDDESVRSFNIQASYDGGRTWHVIVRNLPGTTTNYNWQLPPSTGIADVRIRVIAFDNRFQNSSTAANRSIVITPGTGPGTCYANCDQSTAAPVLNVADFTCFLQRFAAGDNYANCDQSTAPPVLNVADFTCFLQRFAAGCP